MYKSENETHMTFLKKPFLIFDSERQDCWQLNGKQLPWEDRRGTRSPLKCFCQIHSIGLWSIERYKAVEYREELANVINSPTDTDRNMPLHLKIKIRKTGNIKKMKYWERDIKSAKKGMYKKN